MSVTIRRATPADARVLARLNQPVQDLHAKARPDLFKPAAQTPERVAHYESQLARQDVAAFVAEADGEPVGYVIAILVERPENAFTYASRHLLIDDLSVEPAHQRRGIGTALVAEALGVARESGVTIVQLNVYAFNREALAFYARQGFSSTTQRLEIDLSAAQDIDAMG